MRHVASMVLVDYRKNTMAIIIHGAVLCLPIKHPSGVQWGLPHQSQPQQTRGRGAFLWVLPIDSQTLCLCCFEETTFQTVFSLSDHSRQEVSPFPSEKGNSPSSHV